MAVMGGSSASTYRSLPEASRLEPGGLAADPGHPPGGHRDSGELAQEQRGPPDGDVVAGHEVRGLRVGLRPVAGPRLHVRRKLPSVTVPQHGHCLACATYSEIFGPGAGSMSVT